MYWSKKDEVAIAASRNSLSKTMAGSPVKRSKLVLSTEYDIPTIAAGAGEPIASPEN